MRDATDKNTTHPDSAREHTALAETLRTTSRQLEEKIQELSLLRRIGDIAGSIFDLRHFCDTFLDIILDETSAENCSIMVLEPESDQLFIKTARGRNGDHAFFSTVTESSTVFPLGQGVCGQTALERKIKLINDVGQDSCFAHQMTRHAIGSLLCVPLVDRDRMLGVINISHGKSGAFTPGHCRVMELVSGFVGSLVGNALDSLQMREQEKFRAFSEGVRVAIVLLDEVSGMLVDCNSFTEQWLGYGRDELIGSDKGLNLLVAPASRAAMGKLLDEIRSESGPDFQEAAFIHKNGCESVAEISGSRIRYCDREVIHLTLRDITDTKKTRDELQKTHDYLNNIIESTQEGIILGDSQGRVIRANKTFYEMTGLSESEVIGKTPGAFALMETGVYETTDGEKVDIGPEYIQAAYDMTEQLFQTGSITNWNNFAPRKDGKLVPIEQNIVLLKNAASETIGAVSVLRNTTERRKVEKQARESHEFIENIINNSVDGIMVVDQSGIITLVNSAAAAMLGYERDGLAGKHTRELGPDDETGRDSKRTLMEGLRQNTRLLGFTTSWKRKSGGAVPVELQVAFLKNKKDAPVSIIANIRDITERIQAETALRLSEERYRSLVENADDAIISANRDGLIIEWNKKAADMFGYSREEALGMHVKNLVPQQFRAPQTELLKKFNPDGSLPEFHQRSEGYALRRNGTEFPTEASFFTCEFHGDYVLSALVRDTTGRREMERRLVQSEKLHSLGELAGGVAHDFNNILAAILGRSQLLARQAASVHAAQERRHSMQQIQKGLAIIEKAALDGAETVRRIQEFSRRSDSAPQLCAVDIRQIIDDAVEFTKTKWKDAAEAREIEIRIVREYRKVPLLAGSPSELRELFTNLINNAVDAMSAGGEICLKTLSENNRVVVTVKDSGIGIPEDLRDRIFDPFFTTKGVKSTGLGLSVSYGIISRHKGTIHIHSLVDQGTTFTLSFPVLDQPLPRGSADEAVPSGGASASILVVDDEAEVCAMLADILAFEGHRVESASDGFSALDLFTRKQFDIVFTDLGMPGMTGRELAHELKKIAPAVPVILTTGWTIEQDDDELLSCGIHCVLPKPFKMNQALQTVRRCLNSRDTPGAGAPGTTGTPDVRARPLPSPS